MRARERERENDCMHVQMSFALPKNSKYFELYVLNSFRCFV